MNTGLDGSELVIFMSITKNDQDLTKKVWSCRIAKLIERKLNSSISGLAKILFPLNKCVLIRKTPQN